MIRIGKLLLRLMLLCISTLYYVHSYSQICTTDIFSKSYDLGPPKGQFLIVLPGGGTIFGGRDFYNPNQIGLVKTTPAGDIVFNKRIEGVANSNLSSACLNKDKNIVLGTGSDLILLDTNGVVLRSAVTSVPWSILNDLKTDRQGNIYALYDATGADPQHRHVLTKIAPDLSKSLWTETWGGLYTGYYGGILVDSNKVFAVGGFPISGFDTILGSVLCFDEAKGSLIKQISMKLDGYGCTMKSMHKINDGYLMEGFYHPSGQTVIYNHVIVRLNDSLQPIKASRITNLFNNEPLYIEPDGQGGFYAGAGTSIKLFFHCDQKDSVTWSTANWGSFGGFGIGAFSRSATNLYAIEATCWQLLKLDMNGLAGCDDLNVKQGSTSILYSLVKDSLTPAFGSTSVSQAVNNAVTDKAFTVTRECKTTSTCSLLKMIGPTAICTTGTPVVFKGRRSPGCRLPVEWKINGAPASVSSFNDSTISIEFSTSGHYQLVGSLSSTCEVITDTLNMDVSVSSQAPLNLGSDKELCTGNTILLNAQKGYISYTWQDGSTDPTFTVTNPGLYHVTTTDACGGVYKDSVTITIAAPIPFVIGPDRTKCNSDTIRLSAPSGFMNYSWSPTYNISTTSQADVVVDPSVDTTYFVKAEKTPGCYAYDTIHVTVYHSPVINLGADQNFCSGDSLLMDAGAGFSSYMWNGVSGSRYKTVHLVGSYSVVGITSDGCNSYDTLQVKNVWSLPQVNLDHNSGLCDGYSRKLNPGSFSSYLWQDGSVGTTFMVTGIGKYYVKVTDNHNCVGSDTTIITNILALPSDFLPRDTALCSYAKMILTSSQNYSTYLWNNGSKTTNITIDKPGTYWLDVVDKNNCVGRDSVVISPKQCMEGVYVPTAFSPNKDYKNDVFRALVFGVVKKFELSVYNRWGQRVFYTTDFNKGWDGKVGSRDEQPDVFVWMCRYQLEGGQETFDKGTVTIIK